IDRILRLPDTTNLPNAKKRKAGRTECQAKLLWFNDTSYALDAFPSHSPDDPADLPFERLSEGLSKPRDETPSGYGFRFMQDYRAKGVSYEEGRAAILADPTTAGEWARRADVRANNERQLKRAWDRSKPKSKPDGSGKAQTLPSPANPMKVARLFVDQHCLHDNVLTLHHWRGTWWQWRSSYWCELENDAARSLLYNFTENARYHNDEGDLVPWAPTRKKIAALME